ncbi:glycosyltransferase family 4 protein [Deinococcus hopiensis]|uniref:Glycosyltransferase involved in cell wall bisynthesis n=1 Tax=Deinococcus hopiensis KR-140 TaxID=695939 RepID=A0A1W1UH62_9DEIO|nr:glycosyltransferase family 4 protein [Deinococcus hopiensis]SMB80436.1 Glycosyltransferase involved in cell wall bisynthesis [Deinococcus hopiensis KR-140]
MTLHVWFVNHYALAPDQAGGTRHHTLARLMQAQDVDVTLIASSVDYTSRQDTRLTTGETLKIKREEGVRFVWIRTPTYTGNNLGRGRNMLAFAQAVLALRPSDELPRPDVVIGSSPHLFAAGAAWVLARKFGVPFVLEIRDIWPKTLVDLGGMSEHHPLVLVFGWLERWLYRHAAVVVSLLPGSRGHIEEVAGRSVPFMWLPNGIDVQPLRQFSPTGQRDTFDVVYAGAHGAANSLDTVLEAAAVLRRSADPRAATIRFVLVGDGPEKARLQGVAEERGLTNVVFRAPVPKRQVPEVLAGADACLMPLKDSPVFKHGVSPNKLFDYFSAARPVIFAINTPLSAVEEAGAGLSIQPEDPQALADAALRLAALAPQEREAMGERGLAYVAEHHDMKRLARRLANVLHVVAGSKGRKR